MGQTKTANVTVEWWRNCLWLVQCDHCHWLFSRFDLRPDAEVARDFHLRRYHS